MTDRSDFGGPFEAISELMRLQAEAAQSLMNPLAPMAGQAAGGGEAGQGGAQPQWPEIAQQMIGMWRDFQMEQAQAAAAAQAQGGDPFNLIAFAQNWTRHLPLANPEAQKKMWEDGLELWRTVLGGYGIGQSGMAGAGETALPRSDRRFSDAKWREQPFFAVVHQTYLMIAEQIRAMADGVEGLDPAKKDQMRFMTGALIDALSPGNFPLTNPQVIDRAIETNGESLIAGMRNLLADLKRGQLTHTDPNAFTLGENIATTPGKVVYETPLFQLIQYTPSTPNVLATPLVIFPPWINRFYILDLNARKSFVRWAVDQGISVFIVSWKSADDTMAEVVWDDYIRAQIEAVDTIRARLKVPAVHAIGYCVSGTTLAATLAILARRGEADKIKSATFFTAQVDFSEAGDLKHFVDDQQIDTIARLSPNGYLDGRYMAATFNLLRGNDLIWNYVIDNYLLGKDYPAFDMLHWNGDVSNLPMKWHCAYLRDLYRDNLLVQPDALSGDGTPIDLRLIKTPSFVHAAREDHIAPPESVWKTLGQLHGPRRYVLAGSGHIAGVVNPPAANKYQYWTNDKPVETYAEFLAGATEHPGSWWGCWADWLREQDPAEVKAAGKRKPGGRGDKVVEDAPGRYVRMR